MCARWVARAWAGGKCRASRLLPFPPRVQKSTQSLHVPGLCLCEIPLLSRIRRDVEELDLSCGLILRRGNNELPVAIDHPTPAKTGCGAIDIDSVMREALAKKV